MFVPTAGSCTLGLRNVISEGEARKVFRILSRTVLHAAADRGELDVVEYLVEQGADPAAVDSDGNTPADIAADDGHGEVASYLSGLGE